MNRSFFITELPFAVSIKGDDFQDIYFKDIKVFDLKVKATNPDIKYILTDFSGAEKIESINKMGIIPVDGRNCTFISLLNNGPEKIEIGFLKSDSL
jgi:hypothetical protein